MRPGMTKMLLASALLAWGSAQAGSGLSTASELSTGGVVTIGASTATLLGGVSELTVVAADGSIEGTSLLLHGTSEAGSFLIDAAEFLVAGASLTIGETITVTASATGYLLVAAGEVVAFVPNALGRSLIHHRKRS